MLKRPRNFPTIQKILRFPIIRDCVGCQSLIIGRHFPLCSRDWVQPFSRTGEKCTFSNSVFRLNTRFHGTGTKSQTHGILEGSLDINSKLSIKVSIAPLRRLCLSTSTWNLQTDRGCLTSFSNRITIIFRFNPYRPFPSINISPRTNCTRTSAIFHQCSCSIQLP